MMIRALASVSLVLLLPPAAIGQSADSKPAFESADVHTVAVGRFGTNMSGGVLRAGRYEVRSATMIDLIRLAYGVDDERIVGGPSWLESDRFDVIAKAPAGASADTAKTMLRALLADRFGLVVRQDTKPVPAFVLSTGQDSPKMKSAAESGSGTAAAG